MASGKALLVHGVQRVVPLAERVFNGVGGAAGQVGLLGPLEQGSRRQHGFQGTAGNAGAPAQAGLKGIGRARDAEQRVLIKIRAQAGGVGLIGGAGDVLAGTRWPSCWPGRKRSRCCRWRRCRSQPAGRRASAAQSSSETNRFWIMADSSFYQCPARRRGSILGLTSSILFSPAVVNRRSWDEFQLRLTFKAEAVIIGTERESNKNPTDIKPRSIV